VSWRTVRPSMPRHLKNIARMDDALVWLDAVRALRFSRALSSVPGVVYCGEPNQTIRFDLK
jgi:hypothetical protein